ncbi:hypothetical protein V2G26_021344 [Clonostachys chloroleuca]
MRLINCRTLKLEFKELQDAPPYAILSHTWGDGEVTFADFHQTSREKLVGWEKISLTCQQALQDGLEYAWVDTCCIDKSSSAELSESINSMFKWYANSHKCYAFLADYSARNQPMRTSPSATGFLADGRFKSLLLQAWLCFSTNNGNT